MKYKLKNTSNILLISDLDGTLLPSNKQLLEIDIEAINEFRKQGCKFSIATGRTLHSTMKYIQQLEIDMPIIMYNGAIIYELSRNDVLYKQELDKVARSIIEDVINEFSEAACEILTLDKTIIVQNNEIENRHVELCKVSPQYCDIKDVADGGWLKVLFAMTPDITPKVIKYISKKNYSGVDFVQSADTFYEMLPQGSSKGNALKHYVDLCHMNNYKIAAIGDYHNDIEMLKFADISAATANAVDEVKKNADIVLKNNNNEGAVSEFIRLLLTKNLQ